MIEEVIKKYQINGELVRIIPNDTGNINKTYIATFLTSTGLEEKYLIQKINTNVFTDPYKLMKNIESVTAYLKKQNEEVKDTEHKVLELLSTNDNSFLCQITSEEGKEEYYRIYKYIENAFSYDTSEDKSVVFNTGKAFGNFQRLLIGYPAATLEETIKDFHDTEKRFKKLIEDIQTDSQNRVREVTEEITFIKERATLYSLIIDKLKKGEIPFRVTHNDTKVNNILMNKDTKDFLAVVDLDTVMPGSLLFDYGDGIRSASSTAKEDETDLSKVYINLDLFEAYTDGYLSEMAPYLTNEELSLMGLSIKIITLELAIRFLDDYINGDIYFKINYTNHNLDRARNQLKLVQDIEKKEDFINTYINKSYNKYKTRILNK